MPSAKKEKGAETSPDAKTAWKMAMTIGKTLCPKKIWG